ncbi:uncharacterized protein [Palaemon carinicauda]|uniref:uncharacterized protein n=1 Tax=Palaemon carinicauda TaxID=392227 RepID=UPI0035B62A01
MSEYEACASVVSNLVSDHFALEGKSTRNCVLRVLCNNKVKCREFIDLKGAFDRANKDVILEELVNKDTRGSWLRWIESYLSGIRAKVWIQGHESVEMDMELHTPQGGVLSTTLFNVLMDRIARHSFPRGTEVVIYTDDIVIQCTNEFVMKEALAELHNLCLYMGLIIHENKIKFNHVLQL